MSGRSEQARKFERAGNAKLANGLVLQARRYFRIADAIRREMLKAGRVSR